MCYAVYLSTDSTEDLAGRSSDSVRFERAEDQPADPCVSLLEFSGRWYVGSRAGCSCTFRHLAATELGFGEPVDWYREDPDELAATRELYGVLRCLVEAGHRVDLLDRWQGVEPAGITTLEVSLGKVPEREFRLFENHRFRLVE